VAAGMDVGAGECCFWLTTGVGGVGVLVWVKLRVVGAFVGAGELVGHRVAHVGSDETFFSLDPDFCRIASCGCVPVC